RLVVAWVWQRGESRGIARASVTRFEPPCRSTVRASAGQPAASARRTSACVTLHWSVGYSWYQIGAPRAAATSSTPVDETVDRIWRCFLDLAARAVASSPSG